MLDLIGVFEIGVFVRFIPERFFYPNKGNGRPIVTLRCVIHVGFKKFVHRLICVERYEMAVACAYIQFETVFIPYKTDELIRNDYRFDIHAIYIRFAVYLAETILLIDRIIDFGDGISAACLFIYTLIERAVN